MNSDTPIDDLLSELEHTTNIAEEAIKLLRWAHELLLDEMACKCADRYDACDAMTFLIRHDRSQC